jgi:hypothetical protein
MLTMLKDYSISIGPFIDTLLTILGISNHPCLGSSAHLSPKYQNKTNVLPNIMNLLFASKFNPSKTSHPNHAIEVLKL